MTSAMASLVLVLGAIISFPKALGKVEIEPEAPLLTSGFGIITNDDERRIGERIGVPFSPAPEPYYLYWQCLPLGQVSIHCSGYPHYTRKAGPKQDLCVVGIDVVSDGAFYSFFFHQLWDWDNYEYVRREFQRLLRGQKVACFGAEYSGDDFTQGRKHRRSSSWFLKHLKTKAGSWSYFK